MDGLDHVLSTVYRYKVRKEWLTHGPQNPQVQMQYHVAKFVMEEDGPRTLLIVYYAGHGKPGPDPGKLELAGWALLFLRSTREG